jgi:Flp pilus assembly protein TadD
MASKLRKGIELIKQVENEKAIIVLEEALELNSKNPEIHRHLAIALSNIGNHEKSINHFKKALDLDPLHHQTWWNLGYIYEMNEDYLEARKAYQEAAKVAEQINPEKAKRYQEWSARVKSL